IVDEVRSLGVGAVYKEPQFSAQSLDLIAQETGVRVLALHSTLGDDTPTYAEMMRANAQALVDGLAG
ncbi:MAG: zinc ABC transporter substrate-binding protein, partial [Dehalococcoidia bacterium]|nr:zinc ABC transporter substrate-binding protein [Dehalococcoidia bacterium]